MQGHLPGSKHDVFCFGGVVFVRFEFLAERYIACFKRTVVAKALLVV